jgi:hypothetical protein
MGNIHEGMKCRIKKKGNQIGTEIQRKKRDTLKRGLPYCHLRFFNSYCVAEECQNKGWP